MQITISERKDVHVEDILPLYIANQWSSAEKPDTLINALQNSHSLVTAWDEEKLVGLGNAISDGFLVVYFPHLLVMPAYHGHGIGRMIATKLKELYKDFHMQMLTADQNTVGFYEKMGFCKAGDTQSMWIYEGKEH
ncbi:MAG TPA: GNAT family N-acetyltransferase [Saprospiraceae bacterium]|nr:GNAT family N-acetyltransferase [Saprospiraceae bacterium]